MGDATIVRFPPPAGPSKDSGAYFLARRLKEIARQLHNLSLALYENQYRANPEVHNLIMGVESILEHFANELERIAETIDSHVQEDEE